MFAPSLSLCHSPKHPSRLQAGLRQRFPPVLQSAGVQQGQSSGLEGEEMQSMYCNLGSNKLQVCQGANYFQETLSNFQFWLLLWSSSSVVSAKADLLDFGSELHGEQWLLCLWVIKVCVNAGGLQAPVVLQFPVLVVICTPVLWCYSTLLGYCRGKGKGKTLLFPARTNS